MTTPRSPQLVAQGVKPIELVYEDGGQNPRFIGQRGDVSRPDAITSGPTEILLDEKTGKPVPAVVKVAAVAQTQRVAAAPANTTLVAQSPAATAPASQSPLAVAARSGRRRRRYEPVLRQEMAGFGADASSDVKVYEPATPIPTDVPLPPRRDAASDAVVKPQASSHAQSFAVRPAQGTFALAGASTQQ